MIKLSQYVSTIFYILLFLAFFPPLFQQIQKQYTQLLSPHTKVGVISIKELMNASDYTKPLQEFFEDREIKAIVLKMECPGGAAGTAQLLFNEIKELKKQHLKPIVTLVENLCASGGYYIAAATDYIIAPPSAFVGSIGAFIAGPQLKQFIEQFKIQYHVTSSGKYKTMLNPFTEQTPEQRAFLQTLTDDTYDQFINDIAEQRHTLSLKNASVWAEGKIFTARQAQKLGLVDELGSAITVEKYLKKQLPVVGKIVWVLAEQKPDFMRMIGLKAAQYVCHLIQICRDQTSLVQTGLIAMPMEEMHV